MPKYGNTMSASRGGHFWLEEVLIRSLRSCGSASPGRRQFCIAVALAAVAGLAGASASAGTGSAGPAHGLAMHGEPALPPDFLHLPYAQPDAVKGGRLTLGWLGSFDSLNPFIVRGLYPPGLVAYLPHIGGYVYESLMKRSLDEPFSLYGLIAEAADLAPDRRSITFRMRPHARFSDGMPITADDVLFSFALLREQGRPNYRAAFQRIATAERVGSHQVRFEFDDSDRELPLLLGLMPVLPRHAVDAARFDETTLVPPIGSGPYVVSSVTPGASVTYRRDPRYWGRTLPINRGLYNFDEIRIDFYRDSNSLFQAFKRGLVDVRLEDDPTRWLEGFDFPAARQGRITREAFTSATPKGMSGLVFNTRRPRFADVRVREALVLLFDFEWINRNLFRSAYERTESFWHGSELSALGRPAGPGEKLLLRPYPEAVLPSVMKGSFRVPSGDGSGRDRGALKRALSLLSESGYSVANGSLRNTATGVPFQFEILVRTQEQERIGLNFAASLARAGIQVSVRPVDTSQMEQRLKTFDFDMVPFFWAASLSPGNEQNFRWASAAADVEGTFNLPGVRSEAVDALIRAMLAAETQSQFVDAVRSLDRVLMSGFYVLPFFHRPAEWVAYWNRLAHPPKSPLTGFALETWWAVEPQAKQ